MSMAFLAAKRSTCIRRNIGAVIVRDKHVLSTGYNGAAVALKDCLEIGCLRDEMNIPSGKNHEICRAIHAEQNAIIQAALNGVSIKGATIYCTHSPCILCAKMLINTKIKKYICAITYSETEFMELFNASRIEYIQMDFAGKECD